MKYNIFLLLLALVLVQCKEDAITVTTTILTGNSISGSVLEDTNGDGIGDLPVENHLVVYGDSISMPYNDLLFRCYVDSFINGTDEVYFTYTDLNGDYLFEDLPVSEFKAVSICKHGFTRRIVGTDVTPDGDYEDDRFADRINISLTDGEHDDGNNFIVSSWSGSVSGSIIVDVDNDGVGDEGLEGFTMNLWRRGSNGDADGFLFGSVLSDADGNFEFKNLVPNKYVLIAGDGEGLEVVIAKDDTPDPDGGLSTQFPKYIAVDLEDGEADEDNNFLIRKRQAPPASISGFVLDDINLDGIGDEGLADHRIELYERNSDGVPMSSTGSALQADYSDENGYFSFSGVPDGEYVLYHIGLPDYIYTCILGSDLSPEAGEPTVHPECFFIQVDVSAGIEDADNVFLVDKQ